MENETNKPVISGKIDFFFNKLIPKKLIVLTLATVLVFMDKIPGEHWGYVAMLYLGANVAGKFSGVIGGKKMTAKEVAEVLGVSVELIKKRG